MVIALDHILGATGGVEQDSKWDLDICQNVACEVPVKVILNNHFRFGGHNTSALISNFE